MPYCGPIKLKKRSRLLIKITTHWTGTQNCLAGFYEKRVTVGSKWAWLAASAGRRRQARSRSVPCCPILICRCSAAGASWETGRNHLSGERRGGGVKGRGKAEGAAGAAADPINTQD